MQKIVTSEHVGLSGHLRRFGVAVLYAAVVAVVGVLLNRADLDIVDTFDKHVGDWRIALGSPRAPTQRSDIAVILITEETLFDYESELPIDRALVAELVRAIDSAEPKVIGLDLIFDRHTGQDARLIAALKEAKAPVVLGSVDAHVAGISAESLAIQAEFLEEAGRPYGHLMLGRKESLLGSSDSVIRYVAQTASISASADGDTRDRPARSTPNAFSDVLATAAGAGGNTGARLIAWLRPPDAQTELFATLEVPRHKPEAVQPGLAGLFSPSWKELLKDRVVLIGAAMIDRDQHLTPLSVLDRSQMPGVFIQAQALAQRIDGDRDIREPPGWSSVLIAGLVCLSCFVAARYTGLNPHGLLYGIVGVGLIGAASFLAFRFWHIDFPSIALATAWALGGFGGFASHWLYRRLGLQQ
jgi:CHASE2 domain-containing sensor protein